NSSAAFDFRLGGGEGLPLAARVPVMSTVMALSSGRGARARSMRLSRRGGFRRFGLLLMLDVLVRLAALFGLGALFARWRHRRQPRFEERRPRRGHARGAKPMRRFLHVVAAGVVARAGEAALVADKIGGLGLVGGALLQRAQGAGHGVLGL